MEWREQALSEELLNPARMPGESFADYKIRQKVMARATKTRLRAGRRIWDSKDKGPIRIREDATPEKVQQMLRDAEAEQRTRAITG